MVVLGFPGTLHHLDDCECHHGIHCHPNHQVRKRNALSLVFREQGGRRKVHGRRRIFKLRAAKHVIVIIHFISLASERNCWPPPTEICITSNPIMIHGGYDVPLRTRLASEAAATSTAYMEINCYVTTLRRCERHH